MRVVLFSLLSIFTCADQYSSGILQRHYGSTLRDTPILPSSDVRLSVHNSSSTRHSVRAAVVADETTSIDAAKLSESSTAPNDGESTKEEMDGRIGERHLKAVLTPAINPRKLTYEGSNIGAVAAELIEELEDADARTTAEATAQYLSAKALQDVADIQRQLKRTTMKVVRYPISTTLGTLATTSSTSPPFTTLPTSSITRSEAITISPQPISNATLKQEPRVSLQPIFNRPSSNRPKLPPKIPSSNPRIIAIIQPPVVVQRPSDKLTANVPVSARISPSGLMFLTQGQQRLPFNEQISPQYTYHGAQLVVPHSVSPYANEANIALHKTAFPTVNISPFQAATNTNANTSDMTLNNNTHRNGSTALSTDVLGCTWDIITNTCRDLFNLNWCETCEDFGNIFIHNCRCVQVQTTITPNQGSIN
ncbi:hypothetical protein AB6A40_005680 [Gnathostoma spinigerum]|uniref:Uncharacterized protein n=1 Tax=Gnathostoma spinigerum TaxID=75299 RepID=A0ABD6ENG5_9BILA